MFIKRSHIVCVFTFSVLSGCGGGGGGEASVANADPQGFWSGPTTSSVGTTVNAVVLDTGEVWGVYSSGSTITGALYGTTTVNGSTATISASNFNFVTNSGLQGTLTGPLNAKSSMSLSIGSITYSLTYSSTYESPASSAAIAGTWSYIGRSAGYSLSPASITIDNSGNFTLNQANCVTSGSIVPRSGGKNVYNISLTSVGIGCAAGQSTLSGVAYLDTTVTPNKFISLSLTSGKNDGLIVIGTKQ